MCNVSKYWFNGNSITTNSETCVVFQYTDLIIEEKSPEAYNPNLDYVEEYPLLIEPLSQINCVDLKPNGGDDVVNEWEANNEG